MQYFENQFENSEKINEIGIFLNIYALSVKILFKCHLKIVLLIIQLSLKQIFESNLKIQ